MLPRVRLGREADDPIHAKGFKVEKDVPRNDPRVAACPDRDEGKLDDRLEGDADGVARDEVFSRS